jgi:hypothetical protein
MSKSTTAAKAGTISVVLQKPHEQAGIKRQPGETITVTAEEQVWLKSQGVIGKQEEMKNG